MCVWEGLSERGKGEGKGSKKGRIGSGKGQGRGGGEGGKEVKDGGRWGWGKAGEWHGGGHIKWVSVSSGMDTTFGNIWIKVY